MIDILYGSLMAQGYKFYEIDRMDFAGYLALKARENARKDPLYGAEAIDDLPFLGLGAR